MRDWRNGRRASLRNWCPRRVGSSPTSRTIEPKGLGPTASEEGRLEKQCDSHCGNIGKGNRLEWRNWKTRSAQTRVRNRVGSTPTLSTKPKILGRVGKIGRLVFHILMKE